MKKYFYIGLAGLSVFEIINVYFIMPMPGSQQMDSIALAYFLHSWRWVFRVVFAAMILIGMRPVFAGRGKWISVLPLILTGAIVYLFNFQMTADKMFLQTEKVIMKTKSENELSGDRLVIGIENNGEARAYPVAFLAYHHQVRDTLGDKPIMVTYCSVCRTGRVYEPKVNSNYETFRLVGMDHFNAMFEDAKTGSWWRQSTGEAIAGKLKGAVLPELPSQQMTINKFFEMYPSGKVMQADVSFLSMYDTSGNYENGRSKGSLTRTDSASWKDKSWIVGVQVGNVSKAYDWKELRQKGIINDVIGGKSILVAIASDGQSFAAFERSDGSLFSISNDTLISDSAKYDFSGRDYRTPSVKLKQIPAYQEFWHSWQTFHPDTYH